MALLPILEFPDPRLRTKAAIIEPAQLADPAFQRLVDDMFETMYEAPGIGLAASQVDVHQRFMVIDVSEEKNRPLVFVNPEILEKSGEQVYQEGCLSVPNIFADVTRANEILVRALDRHGEAFELRVDGLLAQIRIRVGDRTLTAVVTSDAVTRSERMRTSSRAAEIPRAVT